MVKTSRRRERVRGFTLVEALVVVAILAILTVLAAPSMYTLVMTQKVKTASQDLFVSLATARSEAITRNADVVVRPAGATWNGGWIVATADGIELRRETGYTRLGITGPAQVTFRGNGRPTSDTGIFSIASDDPTQVVYRCVRLHLNGRPYLETGVCS